jgi:hypothetical protein
MLEQLNRALGEYHSTYRHPKLQALACSELYALFPEDIAPLATTYWDATWPNCDRAGVYLIFSETGKLLYVGKAWVIGRRLSSYFQYELPRSENKNCRVVHDWNEKPMYIATVAVPDSSTFEAAALEEFLIRELVPSENKRKLRERY